MNSLDYIVLLATMLGIVVYGTWRTRGRRDLNLYAHGAPNTRWFVIGISVMATQASAVTFLSTPGQGYESGLGFIQNYFGAPFALIIICIFFLPMYRKLNVYTAYEFLGRRFDTKTRLLGAGLFLLQRGIAAGITIYAPAIVLSTVIGWRLDLTIVCIGVLVLIYTVVGGSDAVNLTQKYQFAVIFAGMVAALFVLLAKLPADLSLGDSLAVAGGFQKLNAVDFTPDLNRPYTFWSGIIGGMFLAMSYFGADQSQVQRYLSGTSLRESRLGLMFNAIFKIPMQFFILLLGALLFVFYQFNSQPVFFNEVAWTIEKQRDSGGKLPLFEQQYAAIHAEREQAVRRWLAARHTGDSASATKAQKAALDAHERGEAVRKDAKAVLLAANPRINTKDSDYIFIAFVLNHLPHGLIGLLMAVFFSAAFSSKSAELSALGETTTVDLYRHVFRRGASDAHYVAATKCFTLLWGIVAMGFALFANMQENLIQAGNIVGSVFYGVPLALFLAALFLKRIGGTAMFWSALATQGLVIFWYFTLKIGYLWYNLIGCAVCVFLSIVFQVIVNRTQTRRAA